MKKFFAFAMALVSMAAVMTSCGNDDADFIEQKAPAPRTITDPTTNNVNQVEAEDQTQQVVDIFLPVTDVQLEIMDIEITYTNGGRITTITPEEMTEVKFPARVADSDAVGTVKLLKFRVPGTFTMRELSGATIERTAKLKEEGVAKYVGQKIKLFFGYSCTVTEVGQEPFVNTANFHYSSNANMSTDNVFEKALNSYLRIGGKGSILPSR